MMQQIIIDFFVRSAGALLALTAIAKLVSSFGESPILYHPDPLLLISNRQLFWAVGALELIVAAVCLFGRRIYLKLNLVAWLASCFLLYRLGLYLVGFPKPCKCLGNVTDALHVSPEAADLAMKLILGYLWAGSCFLLFWLCKAGSSSAVDTASSSPPVI